MFRNVLKVKKFGVPISLKADPRVTVELLFNEPIYLWLFFVSFTFVHDMWAAAHQMFGLLSNHNVSLSFRRFDYRNC